MCTLTHMKWSSQNQTHEILRCRRAEAADSMFCGTWYTPKVKEGCTECKNNSIDWSKIVEERKKIRESGMVEAKKVPWRESYLSSIGL